LILRAATIEDLSELYAMLMVMHSGTVDGTSPINSEKIKTAINNVLHRGAAIVAEVDGKIVGSIGGMQTSDWWSDKLYLADLWFFVYKEHRKSRAALRLVKSFLEIGQNTNIKVKLGHVYSGDIDRKDNFYERLGMAKVGSLYMEV
jgi:hypothetical protein